MKIFHFLDELKQKEDKIQEVQNGLTHFLETLAIITSTPTHFVEPQASTIKERVKEIVHEAKEKSLVCERKKNRSMVNALNIHNITLFIFSNLFN